MFLYFKIHKKNKVRKHLGPQILLSFVFTFLCTVVSAQESVNASGGNAAGTGGNVSYSVGQVVYTTYSGTNGSVAQGVQQPYEISIITGIEQAMDIELVCTAYPNPTAGLLTLKVLNFKLEKLSYQLYDIAGKILETKEITSSETAISLENYTAAIYFLKLRDTNTEIKVFKIIKNQ